MDAKRRERILDRAISYIRIFGHKREDVGEPIAKELEELKANRFDALVRQGDSSADVLLAEIEEKFNEQIEEANAEMDKYESDPEYQNRYEGKWIAFQEGLSIVREIIASKTA